MHRCSQCPRTFGSKSALKQHTKAVHEYECETCGRIFGSENAVEQHYTAVHSKFPCSNCRRQFKTARGLERHQGAVHNRPQCNDCGREFGSSEALEQHTNAVHSRKIQRKRSLQIESLPLLKDIEGYWVERSEYKEAKSFGWFECRGCWKKWISAHAFKNKYQQGCQSCEEKWPPKFLWVNTGYRSDDEARGDDDAPHDRNRCDACKAGQCLGRKQGWSRREFV